MRRSSAQLSCLVAVWLLSLSTSILTYRTSAFAKNRKNDRKGECVEILSGVPSGRALRVKSAKLIEQLGLTEQTYVANWRFKSQKGQGPFAKEGETLVTALKEEDYPAWLEKIGKRSIGLMVTGLPEEAGSRAFFRIGDKFYSEERLRLGKAPRTMLDVIANETRSLGYTESTFLMTVSEISTIQKFIDARGAGEIIAQFDISKKGPFKGDVIYPVWTHTGTDLLEESCAAAATSFVDEKWLVHYSPSEANKLRKIGEKYNIKWTHVGRRLIWENFRNLNVSMITIHRANRSKYGMDTPTNLIDRIGWGKLRGLYPYAFIPDNPDTSSNQYISVRIPLVDWLKNK